MNAKKGEVLILTVDHCCRDSHEGIVELEEIIELRHMGTKYQLADIGTKALPAPVFLPLRDAILGKVSFSHLQGLKE